MLISYDKNPNLTEEQRLQSLINSIQMAFNEIKDELEELKKVKKESEGNGN